MHFHLTPFLHKHMTKLVLKVATCSIMSLGQTALYTHIHGAAGVQLFTFSPPTQRLCKSKGCATLD